MRKRRPPKRKAPKATLRTLTIEALSPEGEGIAQDIRVPFALAGEVVEAAVSGKRGHVRTIEQQSPQRQDPVCQHFGLPGDGCGGCTLQHLGEAASSDLKQHLLLNAIRKVFPDAQVAAVHQSAAQTRRRAKFAVRPGAAGFHALASRNIVRLAACDVLQADVLAMRQPLEQLAGRLGVSFEAQVTATDAGFDVALFDLGEDQLDLRQRDLLNAFAQDQDVARLTGDGITLSERRKPTLQFAGVPVEVPSGVFLQATQDGEAALIREVLDGLGNAQSVADLFSGLGTFSLPLSKGRSVHAVDVAGPAIAALDRAAKAAGRAVKAVARDLFARPLQGAELKGFDAVVFDPPRAGAGLQAKFLAEAAVPRVVAVSCNPATMARDLKPFAEGYTLERLVMVDQFRWSSHVEAVAVLRRLA
ncbi:MAG: class I SAM-dependent RNA methyltransferase [Parvularculaceae bacterium]|nr:class I SAM-dependent RNA methyltransferase [Parvularculaceae bacterium]